MKFRVLSWARLAATASTLFLLGSATSFAGDAFLKGGVIFQPRDVGFEGRWRLAFGSDYPVNFSETIFVGFEVETSVFRQDIVEGGPTATVVPANGFVNVKYKSSSLHVRPFGGGGMGLASSFSFVSGGSNWDKYFAFHLLGGVEVGRLVLELKLQKGFDSERDTEWAGYVGFVW